MESEKVKEIKELLLRKAKEYESQTLLDILTLINELETENERLMKLQAIRGEYGRMSDNEIEDRHEIASIINGCLRDGYCTASQLARRITQAGYGNVKQAVKEFAENLKRKSDFFINEDNYNEHIEVVKIKYIDELLKEYGLEVEEWWLNEQ